MVNVLIIGGSGCIGTELICWLKEFRKADKIVCLSRGESPLSEMDGVVYAKGDIRSKETIAEVISENEISHIVHAAALRTTACNDNPELAEEINVNGSRNVFEAARDAESVKRVVFLSTAAVYNQVFNQAENIDETDDVKGYAPYVASKLAGEEIAKEICESSDLEIIAVRPQILFGPSRGTEGSTAGISNAVRAAAKGENYAIPFSGRYSFHFTGDVAPLLGGILLNQLNDNFLIINLPGKSISVRDIARSINELAGEELISFEEKQYPFARSISHKLYQEKVGPCLVTKFKKAFEETYNHFREAASE